MVKRIYFYLSFFLISLTFAIIFQFLPLETFEEIVIVRIIQIFLFGISLFLLLYYLFTESDINKKFNNLKQLDFEE